MTKLQTVRKASFSEIPVVDLTMFQRPYGAEAVAVAGQIVAACENAGFFYVSNHGVPESSIQSLRCAAKEFFDLPLEEKERVSLAKSDFFRGYLTIGSVGYDTKRWQGNKNESFAVQLEDAESLNPLSGPNQWPENPPGFRSVVMKAYDELDGLSRRLIEAFAIGLGYQQHALDKFYRHPLTQLRLLHYPPQEGELTDANLGIAPHSDTGAFTILYQDDVGGLEVLNKENEWVVAPPIPGTLVINIGDMLKWWTNGRFASTPHRVVNRYGRERYSVPFFVNPDFDAVIDPLPGAVDAEHPRKFETVHAGEFILDRFRRVWPSKAVS